MINKYFEDEEIVKNDLFFYVLYDWKSCPKASSNK